MPDEPKVWIVDSDAGAWDSPRRLLRSLGIATTTYVSAEEFLQAHNESDSGCVLTELLLPSMNGLELLERLLRSPLRPAAIVVTAHAEIATTVRSLQLGALTLLEKPCNELLLLDVVRDALKIDQSRRAMSVRRTTAIAAIDSLTPQERQVMDLMMSGLSNKAMAKKLDVSIRTIESRRQRVFRKLNAKSLPELVAIVVEAKECTEKGYGKR